MKTFYIASGTQQSLLLILLFLSLLLSLFLTFIAFTGHCDKSKKYPNLQVSIILFALLVILTDAFTQINGGTAARILLHVPMWLLWSAMGVTDFLLIRELAELNRLRGQVISRNSVKQAIDLLPSGICYFSPSGAVRLCNMQMYRLFRSLAQSDLQNLCELKKALAECDSGGGIIRLSEDRQTYLFPDGRVWRYRQNEITDEDGITYTEAIFSDVTELYHKKMELKEQIKKLDKISQELRRLSENVLTLTKEKEVLSAKTKLHDSMGAGLMAIRQVLQQNQTEESEAAIELFRRAVSTINNDNQYHAEPGQLEKFMMDAEAIGVKVNLTGDLPEQEEIRNVMLLAMRESMINGVRHAGAGKLWVELQENGYYTSIRITNDGTAPRSKVVPKGGLHNLQRHVTDLGGTMEIQSKPAFVLTVTLPISKEETE